MSTFQMMLLKLTSYLEDPPPFLHGGNPRFTSYSKTIVDTWAFSIIVNYLPFLQSREEKWIIAFTVSWTVLHRQSNITPEVQDVG
jgi:hypothetical protein